MSTVIYLSNQDVKAVVGTGKANQATVTRVCRAQAPEGSIINGLVTNEETFVPFLKNFWEENQLPKKDVTLVLGSARTVTRPIQVPKMPHKKMMEYLPREFAAMEHTDDPVYSYVVLWQEGTMRQVIATMLDRRFLQPHVERFQALGVKLSSVVMAAAAEIQALDQLDYIRDKTCIVQMLDGMTLLNIVYVNGHYYQLSRGRIFGERGTPAFGVECARSISNQQQFLKTQQIEESITHIYLGGEFQAEDIEVCKESVMQMDASLEVQVLYEEPNGAIHFQEEQDNEQFEHFVTSAGGLMTPRDHGNLLYQYRQDPEAIRRRRALLRSLAPTMGAVLLLALFALTQMLTFFSRMDKVNEQMNYLDNTAVMEKIAEYDQLNAENTMLEERIGVISRTKRNLDSYPVYTSAVKQVIMECAAGLSTAQITDYAQETGGVTVEASSQNAENVHQFVSRLEARTDLFEGVYYDGFDYDERSGAWHTTVVCYLAGQTGEVTP
ncbi:MAG: hypothetical protein PHV18_11530 [Lachnospiraceae bacterium]|nr:hypothetical protein [Lachnospiraceae bacterium]